MSDIRKFVEAKPHKNKKKMPDKSQELNIRDFEMDVGDLTLDEIAGQDEAINELKQLVESIKYSSIYHYWNTESPKGILLTGGPGLGKTASVRALAKELGDTVFLMELRYLDIASKWVDMPIEQLRGFFKAAEDKSKEKHVIIFIDEIDAMIPNRHNQLHEVSMKRVNVFLEWMDGGFNSISNITLIGATNFPEGMDDAAKRPGRFDKEIVFRDLDKGSVVEALKIHLKKKKLKDEQIDELDWEEVYNVFEKGDLTGADAKGIIDQLVRNKVSEHVKNIEENSDFKNLSKESQGELLLENKYYPTAISTEDICTKIVNFIKDKKKSKRSSSIGFSMLASKY